MRFVVSDEASQRLDAFAHSKILTLSRSSVQKLIEQGNILVNGNQEKTGYKLKVGDKVTIDFDEQELQTVPKVDLPVIYEDDDCIVLDKPVGVLTHSKGAFNPEATVASFIKDRLTDMSGERAGIVHRLDRATSGVIVCAKNRSAQTWLQKQFAQRKSKKVYIAIIAGNIEPKEAIINMPIERDPKSPKQFRVGGNGKSAETSYRVIQERNSYTMLELKPRTGRTHQLRVHLKQLKHPIVGDELYGGVPAQRLMLHALRLELTLPSKERKIFETEIPAAFNDIMES